MTIPYIDVEGIAPNEIDGRLIVNLLPKNLQVKIGLPIIGCVIKFYDSLDEENSFTAISFYTIDGKPDVVLSCNNTQELSDSYDRYRAIGAEITEDHKLRIYF